MSKTAMLEKILDAAVLKSSLQTTRIQDNYEPLKLSFIIRVYVP